MARLSAIQLTSLPDVAENFACIEQHLAQLPESNEHIVVLPECCLFFGGRDKEQLLLAQETYQSDLLENRLVQQLSRLAKQYCVNLVAGSIPLYKNTAQKFTNTSLVFSSTGELQTRYDKIHLFDVEVEDNEKNYLESRYTHAGNQVVCQELAGVTLGLSICYDLRFPELFRQLTVLGANVITVPAAFTKVTGQAHWQALLQARAIENQVYIVAAGQQGIHQNGRETWGHSMIISPWGEIISQIDEGQGTISAEVDLNELTKIRRTIPVAKHNQFTTKLKTYE